MDNMNRYLNEKALKEAHENGPAYYRQAHRAPNPMARYLAEMKMEQPDRKYRLLRLKLPGLNARDLRLPRWALVGKLSQ
ncbi:MAG: hypothetical protein ABI670_03035 [Chloroflexota bacterium]